MGLRGSTLVIKFVFTLFIARFMGFEELGLYGLITAAVIFIAVSCAMGLTHVLTRKVVTQSPEVIVKNLWFYFRFITLMYVVIFAISCVVGVVLDQLYLTLLIVLLAFLEHINNHLYSLILNRSRLLAGNILHFIRSGAWMVIFMAVSLFVPSMLSMDKIIIAWIIGNALSIGCFYWLTRHWPWHSRSSGVSLLRWFRKEFRYSKIAYVDSIVFTSTTYIDRYLITLFLGLELTGVYVFFWSIGSALSNLITTGVVQLSRPKMVKAFKDKSTEYNAIFIKCLKRTIGVSVITGVITGALIYVILPYVNRPLVIEWYPVLWLIIVGFILGMIYQVQNLIFYSQHRDDITLKIRFIILFGAVLFNLTLIPLIGIWGATIAYTFVALLSILVQYIYIKKHFSNQGIYS